MGGLSILWEEVNNPSETMIISAILGGFLMLFTPRKKCFHLILVFHIFLYV